MSVARPIFRGVSLMLTRRARGRTFLLRPSKLTNRVVAYVLAVVAARRSIQLHALVVMSNHWHVCLTDPEGAIVDFQRDCHQFIARAMNAPHGEFENLWSSGSPSRVECESADDLIERIAYTMANPVESALVRHGGSWPGLRRAWPSKPRAIQRPPRFFRGPEEGGGWPEQAVLEFVRPPGYETLSDNELAGVIHAAVEQREQRFRTQYDAEGRAFLGRRRILEQSRHACPHTREPRFRLSPRLACRNKWRRIERLQANKRWLGGYRMALAAWSAGDREVEFPAGTYQMRVRHGVRCASGPD